MRNTPQLDFELLYLTELTLKKIKPLSRWEKPLNDHSRKWIKSKGLIAEIIPRRTLIGRTIYETIFSTSSRYNNYYSNNFRNTLIRKDSNTQRIEGFLFGYPSCCAEQFIKKPYTKNGLLKKEQSVLFHWACPKCRVTPELIPYYSRIKKGSLEYYNENFHVKENVSQLSYSRKIQNAAAAILLSAGSVYSQGITDSLHYIPVENDNDFNGLSHIEEIYLGSGMNESSISYAPLFGQIIDSLPTTYQSDKPYQKTTKLRGIIPCPKCGEYVNMGYTTVINPLRKLQMQISYLELHFMRHGFFSSVRDSEYSRINIDTLKKILLPFDPNHILQTENDSDNDGLTDNEEEKLALNYIGYSRDSDNDGVFDGAQVAEELIRLYPKLSDDPDNVHSSVKQYLVYGFETCKICGTYHNMGYVEITNPENKKIIQIPYLALHSLANGCFSYDGTVHSDERVSAEDLYRAMKTHTVITENDSDNDGLQDNEEIEFGYNPNSIDSNNDGITDAKELSSILVEIIYSLPEQPRLDGPYIERLGMDGIHICSVCGEPIVMEIINIYNPLINTPEPFELNSYNFHFMKHGSFEHEGNPDWDRRRINIDLLSDYLMMIPVNVETQSQQPKFWLEQNYPNPFNPSTTIKYFLPAGKLNYTVSIKIYDSIGKLVKVLFNGMQKSGNYSFNISNKSLGRKMSSGVYYYNVTADQHSMTRKMLLIR